MRANGANAEALKARLIELRESFDRAFSEPISGEPDATVDLLSIRVGREPFALRLSEIAALEAERTITSVPSQHSELLGIAGVRGAVVAVFDLARLLDLPRADGPRWLVLAKGAPLAFAFSAFEGQRTVAPEAIARADGASAGPMREMVRGAEASGESRALPLIDIPALVAVLERRSRLRGEHAG